MSASRVRFQTLLTMGAEQDLESLYDYITESDSSTSANKMLNRLSTSIETLSRFPERGTVPKELLTLGIKEYRQITCGLYRLVYRTIGKRVIVYLIADGRRDMQSVLARRLLR
ncbi:type II toxin-antitoxin system RelE/ParE family toxin [soil metagenome]